MFDRVFEDKIIDQVKSRINLNFSSGLLTEKGSTMYGLTRILTILTLSKNIFDSSPTKLVRLSAGLLFGKDSLSD